jgi:hypothetical protein
LILSRAAPGGIPNLSRLASSRYAATVLHDLQAGLAAAGLQSPQSRWLGKRVFSSALAH